MSSSLFHGVPRCSLAARERGDSLAGTALPVERFILLETPGPWPTGFWDALAVPPEVGTHLRDAAIANHARLLLIRRPGRHPASAPGVRRWAVVTRAGTHWGTWSAPRELLDVDFGAVLGSVESAPARPLALVCTHGRKDVCCAIEGRPVAAALAADDRIDVWECSHVGGDRFAANLLWLPEGLMFGGLSRSAVRSVATAALSGQVVLDHYRGRCGDPVAAQVAVHQLMLHLGEDRPSSITIGSMDAASPTGPVTVSAVHEGAGYRLVLEPYWTEPHHLTCQASRNARMRTYRLLSLSPA